MKSGEVVVRASGLAKSYGAIDAVVDVDLEIRAGELVAMVGDNGAGKSTLAKMLAGAIQPDSGTIEVRGAPMSFSAPDDAMRAGIHTVYQDLALVSNMDVSANIFLGRELTVTPLRIVRSAEMARRASGFLDELEVDVPQVHGRIVGTMSGGQRQAVAVARASYWATTLLIMDEPTAALGVREARAVLSLVRRLRDNGLAVLMISHILPHIMELADVVVVMRHGSKVAEIRGEVEAERLISLIVGYE